MYEKRFNKKVLSKAIQMRPGDLYSDATRNQTIAELTRLGIFQYPSIRYSYADSLQSTLNTSIILEPRERFGLGFGLDLSLIHI